MKNNQNKWRGFPAKTLVFTFLMLSLAACSVNRSKPNSEVGGTSRDKTVSRNETVSSTKNIKPKLASKTGMENAIATTDDDNLKKKVCKKYSSCGCQDYEKCMEEAADTEYSDEILECLLKSSCESLCDGKPDDCAGNDSDAYVPEKPACPQIKCSKNGDCPGTCYGGCKNGICLLF